VLVTGTADSTEALEAATSDVEVPSELAGVLSGVVDAEETKSEAGADSEVAGSDEEAISDVGATDDEAESEDTAGSEEEAAAKVEGASLVDEDACASSADTASAESEAATVDAAAATASTDEAGGSVTEDEVDVVDEGVKGSVEATVGSALDVTTVGGPTAAMTSAIPGTKRQWAT
jgi:hypothetical protein